MKLTYKGFIEDARNEKCSDVEFVKLSQIFAEVITPFSETCAKKPWYDKAYYENLRAFEGACEAGVDEFSLIIEKTKSDEEFNYFIGKFEYDNKNLKILVRVSKN